MKRAHAVAPKLNCGMPRSFESRTLNSSAKETSTQAPDSLYELLTQAPLPWSNFFYLFLRSDGAIMAISAPQCRSVSKNDLGVSPERW